VAIHVDAVRRIQTISILCSPSRVNLMLRALDTGLALESRELSDTGCRIAIRHEIEATTTATRGTISSTQ
jgi:hypothetical protein